jgi:hypothetical protein
MVGASYIRDQVAQAPPSAGASPQRRTVIFGLMGALVFITGVSAYLAMIITPYQPDETSHVGYALSLGRVTCRRPPRRCRPRAAAIT